MELNKVNDMGILSMEGMEEVVGGDEDYRVVKGDRERIRRMGAPTV